MNKYECGNCKHLFDERSSICEDWSDKQKSLICPICKHYLVEVYDDRKEMAAGKLAVISALFFAILYVILVLALELRKLENIIALVGAFSSLILFLRYRILSLRYFIGHIKTRSIGVSNM
ncbi:hypothetical protein [Marinimicrobium alkaliphilum]|uniref:hypothetical protein n=1 Tax=Marinimicrobium alkaliphilum TaxID=2202654 RepID=UPI0013008842|nr:hypothetical protein [Marinimicrobium alkaliphilum]